MFTSSSQNHELLCKNLLCSVLSVGLASSFHLFIAADEVSFRSIRSFWDNVIMFNVTGRGFGYERFCRMKMVLQYEVLRRGLETTICDDDILFIKNPEPLFQSRSDFEVGVGERVNELNSNFDGYMNVGFMHVMVGRACALLYRRWIETLFPWHKLLDQKCLHRMISAFRRHGETADLMLYNLTSLIGEECELSIRFFDPLEVMTYGVLGLGKKTKRLARMKGITEPYLFHLAWRGQHRKLECLNKLGLWYYSSDKCSGKPRGVTRLLAS